MNLISADVVRDIFSEIMNTYKLSFVTITEGIYALAGKKYALIIGTGRDGVALYYVKRDSKGQLEEYYIDSFVVKEFDANDRQNIGNPQSIQEILLAELRIVAKGLVNHWEALLKGSLNWVDSYKTYKLGGVIRQPNAIVSKILNPLLD